MLLHPQDRAYSVPEVMAFVEAAGLIFFGWNDNAPYCADRFLAGEMLEKVLALPAAEQWAVTDNLVALNDRHDFFVRKPQSARFLTRFDTDDYLSYVPLIRAGTRLAGNANAIDADARFAAWGSRDPDIESGSPAAGAGRRKKDHRGHSVPPVFARLAPEHRANFALDACQRMWRSGHVLFGRSGS